MKLKSAFSLVAIATTAFSITVKVNSQPEVVAPTPKSSIGLNGYMAYVVDSTRPGSPTAKAGLKRYDIVLSINKRPISSPRDLTEAMLKVEPGQPVEVMFMRSNVEKQDYEIQKVTVVAAPLP